MWESVGCYVVGVWGVCNVREPSSESLEPRYEESQPCFVYFFILVGRDNSDFKKKRKRNSSLEIIFYSNYFYFIQNLKQSSQKTEFQVAFQPSHSHSESWMRHTKPLRLKKKKGGLFWWDDCISEQQLGLRSPSSWAYKCQEHYVTSPHDISQNFQKGELKETEKKKTHKVYMAFCSLPSNPENSLIM